MITSRKGHVTTTNAATICEGQAVIRRIHLFNPNGSAAAFILRAITQDEQGNEFRIEQWDDSIAANSSWEHGALGGVAVLLSHERLELVLDAAPTLPIRYSVDYSTDL